SYNLSIKAFTNGTLLINKPIELKVSLPPSTLVRFFRLEWPYVPLTLLLIVALVVCIIFLAKLIRKLKNKSRKEKGFITHLKEETKKI
ncbi:MAG: hypothetical protein QW625_03255, partial [Candidatus Nanoarchaeia archaeon]